MPNNILQTIADSPPLFAALKEVILKQFEDTDTNAGEQASDVILGQIYRARLIGTKKVEDAFREIASYRSSPERDMVKNPAR